ncbi:MAG: cytochrome c biogenesis protein CcsA [Phycisphaeraceae bacterium]|nr:cytochrome c biogenesis protein CcsA [Phycisphaeraceae bacterium]
MIRRGVVFVMLFAAVLAGLIAPAWGQAAPEGNAHPEMRPSHAEGDMIRYPFGPPSGGPVGEAALAEAVERKIAFSRAVDLSPLRTLAVNDGGRVKVLATLAEETVSEITGRRRYIEFVEDTSGKPRSVAFDALFTLIDMVIDPGFYDQRPLVHIEYLPLRRAIVERGLVEVRDGANRFVLRPLSDEDVEAYLRLTRVSPLTIQGHHEAIRNAYEMQDPYRQGMQRMYRSLQRFSSAPESFLVVAPGRQDKQWRHLAEEYPASIEARRLAVAFGQAWRAGDAERVNALAQQLAEVLPTINAEHYPTTRRALEVLYIQTRPFVLGYWAYLFALVTLLIGMGTQRRGLAWMGTAFLLIAVTMHAAGFVLRCLIAERFAIQNQFESMTGVSLFASILALGLMAWRRQLLFGAAAAATGFLILITATEARIPGQVIGREAAILNTSVLLKYHVTTVLVSYGLIALGFILSLFYLGTHYGSKAGRLLAKVEGTSETPAAKAPSRVLRDLDRATMIVLQLAFWTLGVGILLGAWWADHSWGRWWAFDPKETWALITWIIYLIVIHVRITSRRRELVTAWLSVLGFIVMLWTYFGVNLLLPGLHAYA